jgi:hypothetical protein
MTCQEHAETFLELLKSPGHWLFELFLMALFDGVIGALVWGRFLKKHWQEHKEAHHPKKPWPICPGCDEPTSKLAECPNCRQELCYDCRHDHRDVYGLPDNFTWSCEPPVREPPEE